MSKKLIASAIFGLGLAASGSASATLIGGVDFGPGLTHLETTTLAETFVNGTTAATGQTLQGYGQINTVNGNLIYAGADRLYFTFTYDVLSFSPTSALFDNGVVNVYRLPTFNLLGQSSAADMTLIQGGTPWATFSGHGMNGTPIELNSAGLLTGNTLTFTGSGLLDVTGGLADVVAHLDTNTINDGTATGFADIAITTSGNNAVLNPFDSHTGCRDGTAAAGTWCLQGSADMRGAVIPEPGSLALVGLGILGVAGLRRRREVK